MWCWCMGGVCVCVCYVRFVCGTCFDLWPASFACWVLWSVSSVWSLLSVVSVVRVLVSRRHQSRRPSSYLCRLVAVALCLCFLCVMRFVVHTPAWNNKIVLVATLLVCVPWGIRV